MPSKQQRSNQSMQVFKSQALEVCIIAHDMSHYTLQGPQSTLWLSHMIWSVAIGATQIWHQYLTESWII